MTEIKIKDNQPGFMHGRSCLVNLNDVLEVITKKVDVIYMDFSKLFENHDRLLWKII